MYTVILYDFYSNWTRTNTAIYRGDSQNGGRKVRHTAVFAWKLSFEMEIWTKAMTSYDLHGNVCYCVYFLSFSGTL